jgi:hypothetical protein
MTVWIDLFVSTSESQSSRWMCLICDFTVNTVLSKMAVRLFYVRVNGDLEHDGACNKVISTRHAYLVTVQFCIFHNFCSFMILRERLTGGSL